MSELNPEQVRILKLKSHLLDLMESNLNLREQICSNTKVPCLFDCFDGLINFFKKLFK